LQDSRGGGAFEVEADEEDKTQFLLSWPRMRQKSPVWETGDATKIWLYIGNKSRRSETAFLERARKTGIRIHGRGKGKGKGKTTGKTTGKASGKRTGKASGKRTGKASGEGRAEV